MRSAGQQAVDRGRKSVEARLSWPFGRVCAVVAFGPGQIVIESRVLGSFEVVEDERSLALGGPKQKALLVVLVLRRGEAVSTDRLVDELWGEQAPASAQKIVQGYVSHLRKALGDGLLVTRGRGYLLQTARGEVDLDRFDALVAEGRRALRAGDPRVASDRLRGPLALWRGPPLADFVYEPFAQREIARLEEERLAALEDRIDADLALGEHAALVGELDALVHDHPLRERLQAQLMLALYRCGRQADALERYQQARRELVDQLGIEPGRALQELERSILEQDPALDPPARPTGTQPTTGRGRSSRHSFALLVSGGALLLAAAVAAATVTSGAASVRLAGDDVGAIATGSGQVALAVPVKSPPTSVAVGKDGAIWVASAAAGTLRGSTRGPIRSHRSLWVAIRSRSPSLRMGRSGWPTAATARCRASARRPMRSLGNRSRSGWARPRSWPRPTRSGSRTRSTAPCR